MRNHLLLLGILLFLVVLTGIVFLRGDVLALALPLMIYLGLALWYAPEKIDLQLTREFDHNWLSDGTPVNVRLILENKGSPVEELLIQERLPNGVKLLDGKLTDFISLMPGERYEMAYEIQPPRGQFTWRPTTVLAGEMFALFGREFTIDTSSKLNVRPMHYTVGSIPIRPPQTRGFAGPIPARQAGSGVEFFSIRNYQPGDPMRHINWKAAARHPFDLFTNTQETERVADVGVILDSRSHLNVTARGDSLFEHSTRAAASLAETFLKDGNRVALLVYGGSIHSVFPGYGKVQRERILNALSSARLGRNYALENLGNLPTRFFPARSQIVLISPLQTEDLPVLVQLRAHGYAVILVSPDPVDFELYPVKPDPAKDYAYRLATIERTFLIQQANRIGVQVVDWKVHEPLEPAIKQAVRLQPVLRRL